MPHSLAHLANQATTVTDFQIRLEATQVLEGQGIPASQASAPLMAAAEEVIDEAQGLLAPAALYSITPVRHLEHEQVVLDNKATFSGSLVTRALAGANEVAMVVCTIGPALEERMSELFAAGEALRAVALEGAGIAAIRQVYASASKPQFLRYAERHRIPTSETQRSRCPEEASPNMAALVQEMVPATAAGVAFSADPWHPC